MEISNSGDKDFYVIFWSETHTNKQINKLGKKYELSVHYYSFWGKKLKEFKSFKTDFFKK